MLYRVPRVGKEPKENDCARHVERVPWTILIAVWHPDSQQIPLQCQAFAKGGLAFVFEVRTFIHGTPSALSIHSSSSSDLNKSFVSTRITSVALPACNGYRKGVDREINAVAACTIPKVWCSVI
jgi:hypothetical protein